jgi:predicted O-methyltransferase YrrM
MSSLLALCKHEINMAWRRWQIHRCQIPTGLADSGWLLHGLVRSMKPEVCVEVGSAHGFSTCLIALALHQNLRGHLWAIDPHEVNFWSDDNPENTLQSLQRNLARVGVTQRVSIVQKRTTEAKDDLPALIDFAFIDGDHSYEGVKQDWEILAPRMNPFGVVVFHDTLWDRHATDPHYQQWRRDNMGVPRFVEELRSAGYPVVTINRDWGISLVQPKPHGESLAPAS